MARASTTSDAFHAMADPRRREILGALGAGGHSVGDLAERLRAAQPVVSKHLGVHGQVNLVARRDEGPGRLYRLNGAPLNPIHASVQRYRQSWSQAFCRMEMVLQGLGSQEDRHDVSGNASDSQGHAPRR
ncbi:MAG: metalloregulator ArsR/SmtB family transcription factor [Candidatus Dormibacteraeota bacterium]|nr:metalloregulator ArsR/SmtB family transcription factor [Candidatus Dormibacteraeota bacterium]